MIERTHSMQRTVLLPLAANLIMVILLWGCSDGSYAENAETDQKIEASEPPNLDNINSQSTHGNGAQTVQAEQIKLNVTTSAIRILAFGDSLTAGYGLKDISRGFPAQLEQKLKEAGYDVNVLNAGISGDTTAGSRSRLDWSLSENPDAVIVELGGNDGLRAIDPEVTYDNLNDILSRLTERGMPVLLAGMLAPPNLGREYGDRFASVYQRLAAEYDVLFYPFFLDGVAGDPSLNQEDRIHPNEMGVDIIVDRIKPLTEKLLKQVASKQKLESDLR